MGEKRKSMQVRNTKLVFRCYTLERKIAGLKNIQLEEGTTTAGINVMTPKRDTAVLLLLSDDDVAVDVHHILDSSTDVYICCCSWNNDKSSNLLAVVPIANQYSTSIFIYGEVVVLSVEISACRLTSIRSSSHLPSSRSGIGITSTSILLRRFETIEVRRFKEGYLISSSFRSFRVRMLFSIVS